HFEKVSRPEYPLQLAASGASSFSQFPILGLTSGRALFRSLSPEFAIPVSGSGTPPELCSPHAGRAQGRFLASLRPTPSSARSRPLPGFRLAPGPPGTPAPSPGPLPAQLARRLPPQPRPALRPLGGYQLVPPARRRRRAANQRLPHCGPAGLGGWDLRLQVRLGQTRELRQRVSGRRHGLRSPRRTLTLLAAPASAGRHAPLPPSAVPGRGASSRRRPPRRCLRRAGTHRRQLRESHLRHGLCGAHARGVLCPLVDCTANTNTCNKYGVSGYPTLKIFRDGEEAGAYDGPRTADGIVSHLKKQAGPASVPLRTEEEFERFISDKDASVVGFFKDLFSEAHSEFLKAASNLRDNYRFAHTNVESLVDKYDDDGEGITLFRPLHLMNKFEDKTVAYTEPKMTSGKIKKFIQENIFGICPHMTEDNKDLIQGKDLLLAYYDVDYEKNAKGSNYWRNRVMMVAKKFLDAGKKLNFAVASRKTFSHELSDFGLESTAGEIPVVAIRTAKGEKFVMQEEFSRDGKALERFLQDYFDGNLKRYLKSEPIPESNDGPVKVVVAENFDEIVNDENKDVLIEFYAPWCGHCKNLEPKYKELGEKLRKDPNIIIAKMDATANDVPSPYEVRGFPTIYFSPANKKLNPKKYEGGRELSDFISYLQREATNPPIIQEEKPKKKKKAQEDL
uniref:Protein disulfide-isomerase n=1 Tax=Sus scrofa TaxID=9823 RepID=A0A4X1VB20_PIG